MLYLSLALALLLLLSSSSSASAMAWDYNQANISLWLSSAAYCDRSTYLSRTFKGPTVGFVATKVIYDTLSETQGYVGYLPSDKSIYVAFRGSSNIPNWISDLDALKVYINRITLYQIVTIIYISLQNR